jgi:hypothetical protein
MTTYDRREKTASPDPRSLAAAQLGWLRVLGETIVDQGRGYNRHMKGKLTVAGWAHVDVSFEGESQSDMPASSYASIAIGEDIIVATCAYKEVGRASMSDLVFKLEVGDGPAKFIENVAKYLVGYTP